MTPEASGPRLRPLAAILAIGLGVLLAGGAQAAPFRIFRLPSEPVDRALIRFAVQAGASVGGFPAPGCEGLSRPLVGPMTPSEALRRMLPAGCKSMAVDAHSFRIFGTERRPAGPPATVAPQDTTPTSVDEIVVTAEKRPEPLRGSPFAVSALTHEEMERLGAKDFAGLVSQLVSVAETNLGPGRNKIFIRGLSDGTFTGKTQSTVGLYLDDVPITYSAPDPDLRFADVERLEVLRGPQGTLYGSGSMGGIVRIVTARPDPTRFLGGAAVEGMANGRDDRSYGLEAMVNLPLLGGKAAVRAVAYDEKLSGYLNNTRLNLDDVNRGRRSGYRIAGLIELPDAWTARMSYAHQAIDNADSQYTDGSGKLSRETELREPHDNDFTQISATLTHPGAAADLLLSAAYIDHDLQTRYDATGAFRGDRLHTAAFDEHLEVELWVAEAILTSNEPGRFRWLAGVFASHSDEHDSGRLGPPTGPALSRSVYVRRDRLNEAAAFGEAVYDITPRLTATLGGRLFATRVSFNAGDFELARSPIPAVGSHLTDQGFTPKLRVSYAFAPDVVMYAQVQEGYRAGGFNVPSAADGMAVGPDVPSFRPDRLRNFEIGGETPLFNRALTLRAAVFRALWTNVQTDQYRTSGAPVTLNIGDGSNTGVEVETIWRPDAHLQVRLNLLLDKPRLTRTRDVFPARVDIGLPGVAKRTAAADVAYRWQATAKLQAEVSAQVSYVGRSFLTFDGGAASAMGGYGSGRIAVALKADRWQARGYVDNVTDERGNTFAFGNPFSRTRTTQATPLRPRTFGLALDRSF